VKPARSWLSAGGPLQSSNDRNATLWAGAKPCADMRWRATAAVGAKGAPTSLRCSGFGRAAKLAALTAFVALGQSQRVSSRSARVRAPTETLRSSPPHRRTAAHPPTAWRSTDSSLEEWLGKSRASSPALALRRVWRAFSARQASGSMPVACQTLSLKNCRSRKAWGRPVPGCVCDGEEHSPGVGARTRALRELTHRICPSATNAVSAASYAVQPRGEHRSEPRSAGRRIRSPASGGPKPCLRHTAGQAPYLRTFANLHNGPQTDSRFMRRGTRQARWSH
jgi:hypothetical protein